MGDSVHQPERGDVSGDESCRSWDHRHEDGSLARQRLTQMRDFYSFLFDEIPALLDRWYQRSGSTET